MKIAPLSRLLQTSRFARQFTRAVPFAAGRAAGNQAMKAMPEMLRGILEQVSRVTDTAAPRPRMPMQAPPTLPAGAQFLALSYSNAAGTRPYKLYVPSTTKGQAVPLVVMLHGCTQSPDDIAGGTRLNQLAEQHGVVIAYPGQTEAANRSRCWNWYNPEDQQRDRGEPSMIAGITQEVMRSHRIDANRVYVAGFSAGGAAAAIMAAAYPELYAAVGIHSGLPCGSAADLPSALSAMRQGGHGQARRAGQLAVPAIIFHGDRDTTVHPRNADAVAAQAMLGGTAATTVEKGQVPGGRSYTRTVHRVGGEMVLEQWVVHGAGHAWAGGGPGGTYTDPNGPDAMGEMLRFFQEHSRPATESARGSVA